MKWKIILILAVTITVYTIIGGIVLHFLESGQISDDHVNIEKAKAIFLGKYFTMYTLRSYWLVGLLMKQLKMFCFD